MQAVIYTHQLEPITVVDIPMWLWERLMRGDFVRLAVTEMVPVASLHAPPSYEKTRVVEIFGDRLRRGKYESLMLFTSDEENALLLKADFLPGQRGELRSKERGAFARGFLDALSHFSPEN